MTTAAKVRSLGGTALVNESIEIKRRSSSKRQSNHVPIKSTDRTNAGNCKDAESLKNKNVELPSCEPNKCKKIKCWKSIYWGGASSVGSS